MVRFTVHYTVFGVEEEASLREIDSGSCFMFYILYSMLCTTESSPQILWLPNSHTTLAFF